MHERVTHSCVHASTHLPMNSLTLQRLIFGFLSAGYIAMIFLWADSSIASRLSAFNPYSLLHIPLYGILTILLVLSFLPFNVKTNAHTHKRINPLTRLFAAGSIALIVGIADEFHQSFIPSRDASVIDLFLDLTGIALVAFIVYHRSHKTAESGKSAQSSKGSRPLENKK